MTLTLEDTLSIIKKAENICYGCKGFFRTNQLEIAQIKDPELYGLITTSNLLDNLKVLCPVCHTRFDNVKRWSINHSNVWSDYKNQLEVIKIDAQKKITPEEHLKKQPIKKTTHKKKHVKKKGFYQY